MAWDDVRGAVTPGRASSAPLVEAYRDTPFLMSFLRHNQDNDISLELQTSHRWDPRRVLQPHLHIKPMANGAGNIRFTGYYSWSAPRFTTPALAGWTAFTVDVAAVAGDQYQMLFANIGNITAPAGVNESGILHVFVTRPGLSDAADTYSTNKDHGTGAANVGIIGIDAHYEPVKAGTETQFGPV